MIQDLRGRLPTPDLARRRAAGLVILSAAFSCENYTMKRDADGVWCFDYNHGSGDYLMQWFSLQGDVLLAGFDHESDASPYAGGVYLPGMLEQVPEKYLKRLEDDSGSDVFPGPAAGALAGRTFLPLTFLAWCEPFAKKWATSQVQLPANGDDGSSWLLDCLELEHLLELVDVECPEGLARRIYDNGRAGDADLQALSTVCDIAFLRELMAEFDYGNS